MFQALRNVLAKYEAALLAKRHVVGCGIGRKEVRGRPTETHAVVVFVERKRPLASLTVDDRIPPELDGAPTDVITVGKVRLLSVRTQRLRPAQPGVSIGHYRVTAGTFGAVAYDRTSGQPFILSNNHVLANTTNSRDGRAHLGDPIYQPGAYDSGTSADTIGHLRRFVPVVTVQTSAAEAVAAAARRPGVAVLTSEENLQQGPLNLIDAALAEPISERCIQPEILGLGSVVGIGSPQPGDIVWKSGRTSGVTQGTVRALSVTLSVSMGQAGIAVFTDQIVTSAMAQPGDSGSAGLMEGGRIFGLLFAGSDQATVFNRIQNVAELLNVRFHD